MEVLIHLTKQENDLIESYAKSHNLSISEFFKNVVLEKIEDKIDVKLFNKAYTEHLNDGITYSHKELKKEINLSLKMKLASRGSVCAVEEKEIINSLKKMSPEDLEVGEIIQL